jgi:hypothetical protein
VFSFYVAGYEVEEFVPRNTTTTTRKIRLYAVSDCCLGWRFQRQTREKAHGGNNNNNKKTKKFPK